MWELLAKLFSWKKQGEVRGGWEAGCSGWGHWASRDGGEAGAVSLQRLSREKGIPAQLRPEVTP